MIQSIELIQFEWLNCFAQLCWFDLDHQMTSVLFGLLIQFGTWFNLAMQFIKSIQKVSLVSTFKKLSNWICNRIFVANAWPGRLVQVVRSAPHDFEPKVAQWCSPWVSGSSPHESRFRKSPRQENSIAVSAQTMKPYFGCALHLSLVFTTRRPSQDPPRHFSLAPGLGELRWSVLLHLGRNLMENTLEVCCSSLPGCVRSFQRNAVSHEGPGWFPRRRLVAQTR